MRFFLALTFAFCSVEPAAAQVRYTVQDALANCQEFNVGNITANNPQEVFDLGSHLGFCRGAIYGIGSSLDIACNSKIDAPKADLSGISSETLWQAFKNWAELNSQEWDQPFFFGLTVALVQTFPCEDG